MATQDINVMNDKSKSLVNLNDSWGWTGTVWTEL